MRENKPSRRFFFALALLLLALFLPGALTAQSAEGSADSSSDSLVLPHVETMTEDEILDELYAILEARESRLNERESLLNEREASLAQREKNLTLIENDLSLITSSTLRIEQITSESANFWTSYVVDANRRIREEFWKGSLAGAGIGALAVGLIWIFSR